MAANLEDDKIITALRQTLQHISLQQTVTYIYNYIPGIFHYFIGFNEKFFFHQKFKSIDVELKETKQQLEQERDNHSKECAELKSEIKSLQQDIEDFKSLNESQSSTISEMQIISAKQTQKITELMHQLESSTILMEEIKIKNEENSMILVNKLEDENRELKHKISTMERQIALQETEKDQFIQLKQYNLELKANISSLEIQQKSDENKLKELEEENAMLQQKIFDINDKQQREEQNDVDHENRIQELKNLNDMLQAQCQELQKSEKDMMIKYQNSFTRMSVMSKCSFNMLQNCRNLRRSISETSANVVKYKNEMRTEFGDIIKQINSKCIQYSKKSNSSGTSLNIEQLNINLRKVNATKMSLNALKIDVEQELNNFDKDIKSVQRLIFKQKSMINKKMQQEKDKTAKLKENEQNMEQRLKNYLQQKDELQSKINELEGFLKEKNEKDIITEMKRFRSAAIVTSVTSLGEDGGEEISYHKLSEHERKAMSLKSKFEKQLNSDININEKVDEFIKSGGLKRYPILEQEFVYEPTEIENNRFRFGTKYLFIHYNIKQNKLYVINGNTSQQLLLTDWIAKNGSNEMRKLLAKISKKKKINKQIQM